MNKLVTDLSDLVVVNTESNYVLQQSEPQNNRFVFMYSVTIKNNATIACQLMSRHWLIQDSNRKVEEVFGEGVIGEQPVIQPGEQYQYTSGAVIETEIGTMEGRYFLIHQSDLDETIEFEITIPKFILSIPRTIH